MHIGRARRDGVEQIPVMVERTEKRISQTALQMIVEHVFDPDLRLIAKLAIGGTEILPEKVVSHPGDDNAGAHAAVGLPTVVEFIRVNAVSRHWNCPKVHRPSRGKWNTVLRGKSVM